MSLQSKRCPLQIGQHCSDIARRAGNRQTKRGQNGVSGGRRRPQRSPMRLTSPAVSAVTRRSGFPAGARRLMRMCLLSARPRRPVRKHVFGVGTGRGRQTRAKYTGLVFRQRRGRGVPAVSLSQPRPSRSGRPDRGVERHGAAAQREGQGGKARACDRMDHESPGKQRGAFA